MQVASTQLDHRSVVEKLGPNAETDRGIRSGPTTEQNAELKQLKRENAALRSANDILKAAAHLFGAELYRQPKSWSRSSTNRRTGPVAVFGGVSSRSVTSYRSPWQPIMRLGTGPRRLGRSVTVAVQKAP